ncbi:MAG: IS110 family transposase [Henriciella sp.]|jgi:transposase
MDKSITVIGLDLAKSVFQVHGINAEGEVVVRRKLSRSRVLAYFNQLEPCLVGMEACATAHYWGRELRALGHDVKLMPPQFVKPYLKSQKNDMRDAEAICEAVTRPTMRFVPIKTPDQQALLALHGVRDHWVRLSTRLINTLRGYLAEFGIVAARGRMGVEAILDTLADDQDDRIPDLARECLTPLANELRHVKRQILETDRKIMRAHRSSDMCQRLETIPGVGPVIATRVVAEVPDPKIFKSGRAFSAWVGLVPKQHSSGGRDRMGRITKTGNPELRRLLVAGAMSMIIRAKQLGFTKHPWLSRLLERKPMMVVAIAMANKIGRMIWALMTKGEKFNPAKLLPA